MRPLLAPVLLLALALSGCGVPQDDVPRVLDRDTAPFRVFEQDVEQAPQGDLQIDLWFVRGTQPEPVERAVEVPGSPRQVLEQLLRGPSESDLAAGYSTAIPTSLRLRDVTLSEGIAVVTLEGLTEQVQVEAYAQMVATLDARPNIEGVRFRTLDGDVSVPRGDGKLSSGAVTRDDYGVLLGLVPPTNGPTPDPAGTAPAEPAPAPTAEATAEPTGRPSPG